MGILNNLQHDVDLQRFNTLAVKAKARYFYTVTNMGELKALLAWFNDQNNLSLLILSGGSNIILSGDFDGLVIRMAILGREELDVNADSVLLRFGGGESWPSLVQQCTEEGFYGIENLALIPGCIGAAPIQNIGAYGVELCDTFESLVAVEISTGQPRVFDRQACQFSYRDSVFKHQFKDQFIITSVTLRLSRHPSCAVDYPALKDYLSERGIVNPKPQEVFDAVCAVRQRRLPDPAVTPNVGSFFKNPIIDADQYRQLQGEYPGVVGFDMPNQTVKLAAAWLIDQAGWKGYESNGVAVHDQQALVLTNPGGVNGEAVMQLARRIQVDILERFGVALEPEPRIY